MAEPLMEREAAVDQRLLERSKRDGTKQTALIPLVCQKFPLQDRPMYEVLLVTLCCFFSH